MLKNCLIHISYSIVFLISFFLFFCGLEQKIEPRWRNNLFELQNQEDHSTTSIQTAPDYLSATTIMLVIFWTEQNLDWQAQNLFNPASTQSSPEVSPKVKRHTFIGMCSLVTWFNMQILNLCHTRFFLRNTSSETWGSKCRNLKKHLRNIARLTLTNITGKITFFNTVMF